MSKTRSLKRCTLESFRGGLRGFGFADVHKGRMAIEGFERFAATGANCARVAIVPRLGKLGYELPRQQWEDLLWTINELTQRRAYCIVLMALASEAEHKAVWSNAYLMASLVSIWREIARLLRGRTGVAGFDLFNEPKLTLPGQDVSYWDGLIEPAVDAVRGADPQRICITSTWPGGVCQTNPEWGQWIRHVPGTVLTAHLYSPFEFTHQGGLIDWVGEGKAWDPYMHTTLQAQHTALLWLRDHALKSGQPVWIGEGAARQDRPGGTEWALHFTQLLQAYRFSGSWHYFIGAEVWHPNDATLAVLMDWFKGGIKP